MSHTNQTPNYNLPQFIGTDKPAWLVDFNQAMSDIDTQMKANETASATAEANAQSALSGVTALNSQVSGLQTDVTAIQTQMPLDEAQIATNAQNISTQASAIVNANNRIDTANANITALNTKVGDLADLDTTDKTSIVNAVNEVKAETSRGYVRVTSDGVKTWSQMLDSLYALIDRTKLTKDSILTVGASFYYAVDYQATGDIDFSNMVARTAYLQVQTMTLKASGSVYVTNNAMIGGANITSDNSSAVAASGISFSLYY